MIFHTHGMSQGYEAHERFYGGLHFHRLIDQTIEEMAELTQALLKRRRFEG